MRSPIICDVDDVMLDWIGGFRKFLKKHRIEHPETPPVDYGLEKWLGTSRGETIALIREFNENDPGFGELEPYADALEVVTRLARMGHDILCLTSCTDKHHAIEMRKKNLYDHFGQIFTGVVCLPLGASKRDILRRAYPSVWIEDNMQHAIAGHEVGHRAIILTRPHNTQLDHPDVLRCGDWHEIAKVLDVP